MWAKWMKYREIQQRKGFYTKMTWIFCNKNIQYLRLKTN